MKGIPALPAAGDPARLLPLCPTAAIAGAPADPKLPAAAIGFDMLLPAAPPAIMSAG
jgi:hypothetical protein